MHAYVFPLSSVMEHPNADRLEIATVGGWTTCVRKGEFREGDLVIFIEPDTLVDLTIPEFSFLTSPKIKAKRLRGVQSFGILIKAREGWEEGFDAWEPLGLTHWNPPEPVTFNGECEVAPKLPAPKYDMESFRKFDFFIPGEDVEVTEKIHGANGRWVWDDELHVGSHTTWKRRDSNNLWWKVAEKYELEKKLAEFPKHVFYGEVFGQVQDLKYGANKGELFLAIFDILVNGNWMSVDDMNEICAKLDLPRVPLLYRGPYYKGVATDFVDGKTRWAELDQIREGVVLKTAVPRSVPEIGRVILKNVSVDYLSR